MGKLRRSKLLATVFLVIVLSGCSSVTVKPNGGAKITTPPTYLDSKNFYLFGLIGKHQVDVNEVCEGAEVLQLQTVRSLNDYLLGTVTWFLYSPRTAKVWCGE